MMLNELSNIASLIIHKNSYLQNSFKIMSSRKLMSLKRAIFLLPKNNNGKNLYFLEILR